MAPLSLSAPIGFLYSCITVAGHRISSFPPCFAHIVGFQVTHLPCASYLRVLATAFPHAIVIPLCYHLSTRCSYLSSPIYSLPIFRLPSCLCQLVSILSIFRYLHLDSLPPHHSFVYLRSPSFHLQYHQSGASPVIPQRAANPLTPQCYLVAVRHPGTVIALTFPPTLKIHPQTHGNRAAI